MNRADLVSHIAELTGQPKVEIGNTLTAILHTITGTMGRGDKVTLVGFGTFERRTRQARTGRNPRTLSPLRIPASKVPAFRAGQELKDTVDGRARLKNWSDPKPATKKMTTAKKSTAKKPVKSAKKKR
ncbi:MAG: HU family DNA-binding protein [Candidatus Obscuribacter sp.]|jgi:DNA-binding protein HU-beta|nr:HU family DNA-binding protein [Candidatus Obscuribacter sp.]MBK9203023.1 HU family DNA-binding protein [Candidatus Obscuribacter sp.]MBK9619144.1 HU family DNA-binding protein [Candidatus Obscuribacter sp.]MBL0184630.1 HU family DNA-binding protein [Candidatus Obscuribacter sp.]MBP6348284.1 HU family DNA-binding protein [Candidatus Obscuribacter sp.]